QAGQWERAQKVWAEVERAVHALEDGDERVEPLLEIGAILAQAGQWERAQKVWAEAEWAVHTSNKGDKRVAELIKDWGVESALAEAVVYTMQKSYVRVWALSK